MTRHELLVRLRNLNHELIKLELADPPRDVTPRTLLLAEGYVLCARQNLLYAIRRLDPESAVHPVIEEVDVAEFHVKAEGAGTLLLEQLRGGTPGSSAS